MKRRKKRWFRKRGDVLREEREGGIEKEEIYK